MSDSTIDNSSVITTIDVKEKKVVVEEAENQRVASANRNADEGNAEQEANKVDEKRKKAGRKSRMWRKVMVRKRMEMKMRRLRQVLVSRWLKMIMVMLTPSSRRQMRMTRQQKRKI